MDNPFVIPGDGRPAYFLHIHKTAGSTFSSSVLPQIFPIEETCIPWSYTELFAIPPEELPRFRLFRGHFYYCLHKYLPAEPVYLTFLRHPIERLISLYEYVRRTPDNAKCERVRAMRGFLEFAWDAELASPNFQVMSLTADADVRELFAAYRPRVEEPYGFEVALWGELVRKEPAREDLELAKRRLAEFFFVGITERFRESVELLCQAGGWPRVQAYDNVNVSPPADRFRIDQIPASERDALMERHRLDFELYDFGLRLFETRLRQRAMAAGAEA